MTIDVVNCPHCMSTFGVYRTDRLNVYKCCYCGTTFDGSGRRIFAIADINGDLEPKAGEDLDDTIEQHLRGGRRKGVKRDAKSAQVDAAPAKPILGRLEPVVDPPGGGEFVYRDTGQ